MPLTRLPAFTLAAICLATLSCSRAPLERELNRLKADQAALEKEIAAYKEQNKTLRREQFLNSTSPEALAADTAREDESAAVEEAETAAAALSALHDRVALLRQRNEQLRSEVQAYRARHSLP